MTLYIALLLLMTFFGALGALFFKRASGYRGLISLVMDVNLYIGGFLYLTAAILNVIVLRKLDYTLVLPITSVTYIWSALIASIVLNERITLRKLGGVALIVIGAFCVSIS